MIGVLTHQKCASCMTRRLWALVRGPFIMLVCGYCDRLERN